MQIAYISNRPQMLQETLAQVTLFMPFVQEAVACVPDRMIGQYDQHKSPLPLRLIKESDILEHEQLAALPSMDHQSRNYLLRSQLVRHGDLNDEFLMSDDDARPLKMVDKSRFISERKYRNFFYYDMRRWHNNQTDFDAGQISTCTILQYHNLPQLSYASHMPQVINRALFLQAADFFKPHSGEHPLCEWSTYFNYAVAHHPDRFLAPEPYTTLCWPEHPLAWQQYVVPQDYVFENYTPANYEAGKVFAQLSFENLKRDHVARCNLDKIVRWHKHEIDLKHPEQGKGWKKYLNWRTWVNKATRHLGPDKA